MLSGMNVAALQEEQISCAVASSKRHQGLGQFPVQAEATDLWGGGCHIVSDSPLRKVR